MGRKVAVMDYRRTSHDTRADTFKARSRKARAWARLVKLALVCAIATAIWQDRALSPQAHDWMKQTAVVAGDWLEQSKTAKSYLTAMSNFGGGGNQGEFSPITEALLDLRQ